MDAHIISHLELQLVVSNRGFTVLAASETRMKPASHAPTRPYFASKTSETPCHSFIPAQLFAFAGT